ncbi:hypothetical protein [Streptacidiphilus rugosus]|uniref:hypothetical protein n=1 Tax=Streptacidiphilus rugosus TaxID=405783 RepID=UPI00055AE332|nr:hypothetical protein [Streptacidiphilus rugosus]
MSVPAIACGVRTEEAAVQLDELHRRHLLTRLPGDAPRYAFRDYVHDHARRLAERTDCRQAREDALRRAAKHLGRSAAAADYGAFPDRWHLGPWYDDLKRDAQDSRRSACGDNVRSVGAQPGSRA